MAENGRYPGIDVLSSLYQVGRDLSGRPRNGPVIRRARAILWVDGEMVDGAVGAYGRNGPDGRRSVYV